MSTNPTNKPNLKDSLQDLDNKMIEDDFHHRCKRKNLKVLQMNPEKQYLACPSSLEMIVKKANEKEENET